MYYIVSNKNVTLFIVKFRSNCACMYGCSNKLQLHSRVHGTTVRVTGCGAERLHQQLHHVNTVQVIKTNLYENLRARNKRRDT